MNILIINWRDLGNPLFGGAEIHISKIARYLARENNVFFLTSDYNGVKIKDEKNLKYIRMGSEFTFNFTVYKNIKSILKYLKIDLIIEDINKIPFFTPLFTNLPVLVVIPHIFGKTIFHQTNPLIGAYVYLSEQPIKYIYKNSFFEVISKSTSDDLIRRGIDASKIKIAECGIDENYYDVKIKKADYPLIVYVGRLKKYKSVDHIIRAFPAVLKKSPDSRLIIVGAGDYAQKLKEIVSRLNLNDNVEFSGFVTEERKLEILSSSWVSVYPSLIEGWGIVNIEANALKTPVICSDVPGLRDSVKQGFSGELYKYGNINQLSDRISDMISDGKLHKIYCDNAFLWSKNFNWENTGKLTKEWIDEFLQKKIVDKNRG